MSIIYFNKLGDACAFEVPGYIATVDLETWMDYSEGIKDVDWTITDGKFVKLNPVEKIYARLDAENRIYELKKYLSDSDYQAIKFSEGAIAEEEYAPIRAQRQAWRDEINELEKLIRR